MYYGEFSSKKDICDAFSIADFDGVVLFACYDIDGYEGSAAVIFVNDGKVQIVEGAHCSCYGLEQQWEPDEVPVSALRRRIVDGSGMLNRHAQGLLGVLERMDDLNLEGLSPDKAELVLKLAIG